MSKRCLGFVLLALVTTTTTAFASLTSSRDPIDAGNIQVNTTATQQADAVSSSADVLDHFHLTGAGCADFAVSPTSGNLPRTINAGTPMGFDVDFTPQARGAVTCTVSFHTAAHVSIGTDFTIEGTGVGGVIDAPASVTFPARRVDNGSPLTAALPITIQNDGDGDLTITALATTGDFSIPAPPPLPHTLSPTETLVVNVQFDPSAAGVRNGTFDITSDDPATPNDSVALDGQGTLASIAVTDVAFGIVQLTQTTVDTIAVTNSEATNPGPLRINSAQIIGGDGWFTFDANGFSCLGATTCNFTGGVLAPRNVGVRCTPPAGATGAMTATVMFASDADGGDNIAGLSCVAGRADATVDPTSLDFGAVQVGSSAQRTVTVTNTGNIDLVFTVTKVGTRQGEYAFSACALSPCTVAPGDNQAFTTTFTPTQAGGANITINVNSNDPNNGVIPILVTATSTAPAITAPAAVAFGNVEVVTPTVRTLTITNSGSADLLITSSSLTLNTDNSYAVVAGTLGAQTVPANGGQTSWDITCSPPTIGSKSGRFTINSNAINGTVRDVNLTCAGTEGILVVIPTSIDFGGVAENSGPIARAYRLRNNGNLPVTNISAVINPNNVGYSLDPATPFPAQILPGAANEVTLNVLFTPLSAADGGPATVTFSGQWGLTNKPLRVPPVLALDGDGLTTGFDVTPPAIAFGDLRFDTTATDTFCIVNTSQSAVRLLDLTITPMGATVTGELSVVSTRLKTCGTPAAGTPFTFPNNLNSGLQIEVTIRVDPANRVGAIQARADVISNLLVNGTRSVDLTANSTTGALTLAPGSTVDFGPRDVQGPSQTIDVVITNSGDGPLDLRNFARSDGGTNTHFTFTLPPNTTVQPGQSLTIPVTYTPTVVTMPAEQIVLTHQIVGILGGPNSQSITITGIGIDRELQILGDPMFPPTFRNLGSQAPVRAITVRNNGAAPLRVTAVMITQGDTAVWTVTNPDPVDLPAAASIDYLIRFAPTTIGPSSATLMIVNDDDANPMATVEFSGLSVDRGVGFGASVVNVGFTGVGVPITLENAIAVSNMNTVDFTITRVEITDVGSDCAEQAAGALDGVDAFAIQDSPIGLPIGMDTTLPLAMTFTPETEGKFVAAARLFIDPDPVHQATVCIVGNAVFVDAHGGGGCDAGGGDAGVVVIALLAIALVVPRRRAAVLAVCVCIPLAARADNVVLSIFDPTPATTGTNFQLQSPEVGNNGDWVLTATVSHATNPLVLDAFMEGVFINNHRVVERSTMFEIGGAYAFLGRFEAGVRLPLYAQAGQPFGNPQERFTTDPASGAATGDLVAHAKARLWRGRQGSVATALQLTLPTATEGEFTGTDKPSGRALVLGALVPNTLQRRITLSANFGAVLRAKSRFANIEQGGGATWGLGLSVRTTDRMWLAAEMFGDVLPSARLEGSGGDSVSVSPIEWLAGLRWFPDHRFALGLAAGRGLTSAVGAPEVRGVLTLAYAPGAPEIRPLRAPEGPDIDTDGDGIFDRADRCKTEAEDPDLFEDTDGCPDNDNDADGVADGSDKCPLDAEDKDGFQDDDGCIDKDNDNDQIADAQDKCPNQSEDKDGFQDVDGCPDDDNDADGIADAKDKCPTQQETINGNKDDDGCPDAGDSAVVLSPDRLETLDAISFVGGAKIAKGSFNVLGQVAATMRKHPEIIRMRVTCHVQPTGDDAKDQDLSDKRAQAIRDWLVQWGIDAKRVESRGFGGTKPLADPAQRGSATLNERIELIIMERK